jgi:hypothetical protein
MDHYEVREYLGWHHHMLTTMLAPFFLWHLTLHVGKKSASVDSVAGAALVGRGLPSAAPIDDVLALVAWGQRRNHQAYQAHRKRRRQPQRSAAMHRPKWQRIKKVLVRIRMLIQKSLVSIEDFSVLHFINKDFLPSRLECDACP